MRISDWSSDVCSSDLQTAGLAGALKKIAGIYEGSKLANRGETEEISHMLFGDDIGFSGLFATHPPILQRIQALEPGFRAEQLERLPAPGHAAPPTCLTESTYESRGGEARVHNFRQGGAHNH